MVVIWLAGGLGNHLFQYAFGKAIEHKGFNVIFDASWYKMMKEQNKINSTNGGELEIMRFNLTLPIKVNFEKNKFLRQNNKYYALWSKLYKIFGIHKKPWLKKILPASGQNFTASMYEIYDKESKVLDLDSISIKENMYFWGYWQSLSYFKHLNPIICKEFTLKDCLTPINKRLKSRILSTKNSVFLHIRRGDYLEIPLYIKLGKTYYENAIKIIKQKIKKPHIFVFSNDIEWCERNFLPQINNKFKQGVKFEFIKNNIQNNAIEEFELMRSCQHGIIANSTFSWWAGYLIKNPSKIIIMPNKFFTTIENIPPHPQDIIFDGVITTDIN